MPIDFNNSPADTADEIANRETEPDLLAQLEAVTAERDQLAAAKSDFQDRFLRRTAEFENFRRRVDREKSEFLEYASSEAVTALLPVLDDFEYVRGMEMIFNRLVETLKKLGLEPISSLGQTFDPYVHQAVDRVETNEAEDHAILQEHQRGYNFKGRLLRPAMVQVAIRREKEA